MNIDSNNVAEQDAINQYLSCVQLKLDCETICSLVKSLQQDGVTGFGVMPYITLTAYTALEILSSNDPQFQIPYSAQIKDIRMKLKIFEDGYSKSKRMLLNIDYLQDQILLKTGISTITWVYMPIKRKELLVTRNIIIIYCKTTDF